MSHQSDNRLSVITTVSGIAGVTVTVIVLITWIANAHANSSAPSNDRSARTTVVSNPTDAAGRITDNDRLVAATVTSEPTGVAGALTSDDGFIAGDATLSPFAVDQPAVGNLNRDLLTAIQRAATDAANDGIEIRINSGWRSTRYQQHLLNEAVIEYGSEHEARKWVSTPEQSSHVTGNAVDIAPTDADEWLGHYGSQYGLCQIYANEIWHFELAIEPGSSCPPPKTDASEDSTRQRRPLERFR